MKVAVNMELRSFLIKNFVQFICSEYDIVPKRISISSFESESSFGLCIDENDDEFLILVKEKDRKIEDIFVTIAHEMVHVKQYMKENLGWFLDNRCDIPYSSRWWEKEAFSSAVPLVEKFAKGLNA